MILGMKSHALLNTRQLLISSTRCGTQWTKG